MSQTGCDVLKKFITTFEIEYIFGNPGTTELQFLETIQQCEHATYFLTLQESNKIVQGGRFFFFRFESFTD